MMRKPSFPLPGIVRMGALPHLVILAAAGIQILNHTPRPLCQIRHAKWTGRRPTNTIPADPHQVEWEKGLWIPTAVRMTGSMDKNVLRIPAAARITEALPRPRMRMKMAHFHCNNRRD